MKFLRKRDYSHLSSSKSSGHPISYKLLDFLEELFHWIPTKESKLKIALLCGNFFLQFIEKEFSRSLIISAWSNVELLISFWIDFDAFCVFIVGIIGLRWSTEIRPKSFFGNHLTSWPGFDSRDGKFPFLLFYLIWLSLSSESSQFKNLAKILKTLWGNNIFNKKHVIIKKLLII